MVPPWGSSIRRPPKVCEACWTLNQSSSAKCQTQSQMANLKGQALMQAQARDPLSFSLPRRVGTTGNQVQKSTFCVLLGLLGRFFALPKRASKMTSKKHRKKCENLDFRPPETSQNPSKMPPKTTSPQRCDFFMFFARLFYFFLSSIS